MVSVIIPCYNLENYIKGSVETVLNQTYNNLEIIIVDDGSKDKSVEIIRKLQKRDNRIKLIVQKNKGAGSARNRGMKEAKGEFLIFLDGDDKLTEDTIEKNLTYLIEDNSFDWVAFPIKRVDEKGKEIFDHKIYGKRKYNNSIIRSHEFIYELDSGLLSGVCWASIYRNSIIRNLKFPENEFYEDSFFYTDLLINSKKGFLSNQGCYLYLHRPGSSQLQPLDFKHLQSHYNLNLQRIKKFRNKFPQFEEIYRNWETNFYYFLKNEKSKKTEGAGHFYNLFGNKLKHKIKKDLKKELKYYLYKCIGYRNLKRIL